MIRSLSLSEWTGLVTAAGILATFGLSLYTWLRHHRPSRKVKAVLNNRRDHIEVSFINERGPDVVVTEVGFECDDGTARPRPAEDVYEPLQFSLESYRNPRFAARIRSLPRSVPAGQSVRYYFELSKWRHDIQQEGHPFPVRAYCRDETDRVYRSSNLGWDVTCALGEHDPT